LPKILWSTKLRNSLIPMWLPWDISAYCIKSQMMPLSLPHFGTIGKIPKNFSNFWNQVLRYSSANNNLFRLNYFLAGDSKFWIVCRFLANQFSGISLLKEITVKQFSGRILGDPEIRSYRIVPLVFRVLCSTRGMRAGRRGG
jgi:hypothetical protein